MIDVAGTHMARRELCQGENDYDNPNSSISTPTNLYLY